MCDDCAKLQEQVNSANNYNLCTVELLAKLVHKAGLSKASVAKLDVHKTLQEVTQAFDSAVVAQAKKEASQQDAVAMNEAFEELPEVWSQAESLAWLQATTLDPQQIDNMVELFELIGFTTQRLQFVLTSADMAHALHRCG
jgi:hypothetical protein